MIRPLAAVALAALAHAGAGPAALGRAREHWRHGRHAEAAEEARRALRDPRTRDDAGTLLGEIARETGRHDAARGALESVLGRAPDHRRARLTLALVLGETGREDEARRLFESFYDDWDAGRVDRRSAVDLTYVAMAARALGRWHDANDTFRDATRADPAFVQAHVEWGRLLLDKYAAGEAEASFAAALRADPADPEAHVGMARVKLEQGYDLAAARAHLGHALGTNPRHAEAHALGARLALDLEDHATAAAQARAALATDPRHVEARVVLAASALLRGDRAGYERERGAVLAVNPRAAAFDHGVAVLLGKAHRYAESIDLERRALDLRPDDAAALAGLATNLLRQGDEELGVATLRRAWERDRFNVRTYNLLNLFDEVVPRDYTFAASEHFRLRVPRARLAGIAGPVLEHLERAWAFYVAKYGFTPVGPVVVELYEDADHYAVRTVGLPGLGVLGVCFGRVITSRAPSGAFNWAQVLWHEMSHVFTLQMSRARVPRWLTEGIADHEAARARPEWRRPMARELHAALGRAPLPPLAELHRAFVQARDVDEVVLAYYYSQRAVDFLVERFGVARVLALVRFFGEGLDARAAIERAFGVDADAIDRDLRAAIARKLAIYDGQLDPRDERAPAALRARFAAAVAALDRGDAAAARAALDGVIADGGDGYAAREFAARVAEAQGDLAAAVAHQRAACRLDPEADSPLRALARLHARAGRPDDALAVLARLGRLGSATASDLALQKRLLAGLRARGKREAAWRVARTVLDIDPEDAEARVVLAQPHGPAGPAGAAAPGR